MLNKKKVGLIPYLINLLISRQGFPFKDFDGRMTTSTYPNTHTFQIQWCDNSGSPLVERTGLEKLDFNVLIETNIPDDSLLS